MDCCLSYNNPSVLKSLPSSVKIRFTSSVSTTTIAYNRRPITRTVPTNGRPLIISSTCEFSGLNTPLELKSPAGKFLSGVLQNDRKIFHQAVAKQLELLVSDRHEALARVGLSFGTTDASLYRFFPKIVLN